MLHHEYDALKGYRFLGGAISFYSVSCMSDVIFNPSPTKLVFAYFDRGSYMSFGVAGVWSALSDILMHKSDTVKNLKSPHLVAVTTYHVLFIFILRCLGSSLVFWDSPFDLIFSDTY